MANEPDPPWKVVLVAVAVLSLLATMFVVSSWLGLPLDPSAWP